MAERIDHLPPLGQREGRNYRRPYGSRCHAHDLCETCAAPVCDDCSSVPSAVNCPHH